VKDIYVISWEPPFTHVEEGNQVTRANKR